VKCCCWKSQLFNQPEEGLFKKLAKTPINQPQQSAYFSLDLVRA
jgi:hypothetical protein